VVRLALLDVRVMRATRPLCLHFFSMRAVLACMVVSLAWCGCGDISLFLIVVAWLLGLLDGPGLLVDGMRLRCVCLSLLLAKLGRAGTVACSGGTVATGAGDRLHLPAEGVAGRGIEFAEENDFLGNSKKIDLVLLMRD
jgi:hypothetical protein